LLLGLPYGFNDAHFGHAIENSAEGPGLAEQRFIRRCAFIAGKVIDRNMLPGKPSSASSMLLDEHMSVIGSSMPGSWWTLPDELHNSDIENSGLRERLLQQYYFFYVRINIHLPFLVKSSEIPSCDSHRRACALYCQELLRRFVILRSQIQGSSIFDCKTSDFVGFMAAICLLIGRPSSVSKDSLPQSALDETQSLMILVKKIFMREEKENGCRIALQCRKILELLSGSLIEGGQPWTEQLPQRIAIPYFGFITRNSTRQAVPESEILRSQNGMASDLEEQTYTGPYSTQNSTTNLLGLDLGRDGISETIVTDTYWTLDDNDGLPIDSLSDYLDTAMLDMNQDLGAFFDDYDDFSMF
jgi:hypothetical protein